PKHKFSGITGQQTCGVSETPQVFEHRKTFAQVLISNLSWPDQFQKNLAGLKPLIRILEISSADIPEIDNEGEISFVKE
ncbi:MAG: hypothetical protein GY749_07230, partial [Desulfobacteraceae bacterium]|nr:hypothetical protein [Desulfobacteraceae bacterium]